MKCARLRLCGPVRGEPPKARYSDFRFLPRPGFPRRADASPIAFTHNRVVDWLCPRHRGVWVCSRSPQRNCGRFSRPSLRLWSCCSPPVSNRRQAVNERARLASPDASRQDPRVAWHKKGVGRELKRSEKSEPQRHRATEKEFPQESAEKTEETRWRIPDDPAASAARYILIVARPGLYASVV